jgi:hypothetical protein
MIKVICKDNYCIVNFLKGTYIKVINENTIEGKPKSINTKLESL